MAATATRPQNTTVNKDEAIDLLEQVIANTQPEKIEVLTPIRKCMELAKNMKLARRAVEACYDELIELKDSPIGFMTDRAPGSSNEKKYGPYSKQTIIDVLTEGACSGCRYTGNEINIFAGRLYRTKQFFQRKLLELEGLKDLEIIEGVPVMREGGALMSMYATYTYQGKPGSLRCEKKSDFEDTRIPVRVNDGMGADAVIGKAQRKFYARIYNRLTGSKWAEIVAQDTAEPEAESVDLETVIDATAPIDLSILTDPAQIKTVKKEALKQDDFALVEACNVRLNELRPRGLHTKLSNCKTEAEVRAIQVEYAEKAESEEAAETVNRMCEDCIRDLEPGKKAQKELSQ